MAIRIDVDRAAMGAAVLGPLAAAAALAPMRRAVDPTNAALVLVVVVVAVSATGRRWAGLVAALSATAWFDFFLTRPYHSFTINSRADLETAVLLLLVGLAVSEVAAWGRRRQAEVIRRDAGVYGIDEAVASMSADELRGARTDVAATLLVQLLGLKAARFEPGALAGVTPTAGASSELAQLRGDGQVEVDGAFCDVESFGLPLSRALELRVRDHAGHPARFVLDADESSRPSTAQRLAAVAVASWAVSAESVVGS
jgi:hypothetical protein